MKLIFLLVFFIPSMLFGAVEINNNAAGVLGVISAASTQWVNAIKPAGLWLFLSFIVVDFVLTFGPMASSGFDAIFWKLIEKILWIGFFLIIFQNIDYLTMIPESFAQIATNATTRDIQPDTILEAGMELVIAIWDGTSITDMVRSLAAVFAGVICLIAFSLMAAQLFMTLVKIQMLIAGTYIVLSLGGLAYTRSMAISPLKALFAAGMELMFIKLTLALTIDTIEQLQTTVDNDVGSYVAVIVISIILASVVNMINGIVNSLLSGTLGGNSTSGLGTAASVAGGAVAGAAAAGKGSMKLYDAAKSAKQAAANSGGSAMGHFARSMGEDLSNTIRGKKSK